MPTHLQDGEEFSLPLSALLIHGKLLFDANWTEQEGGGRPLTKGTGRPLADPTRPLTGLRAFNRVSAPDANSLHRLPQRAVRHFGRRRRRRHERVRPRAALRLRDVRSRRHAADPRRHGRGGEARVVAERRRFPRDDGHVRRRLPGNAGPPDDRGVAAHARHDPHRRDQGAVREGHLVRHPDADQGRRVGHLARRGPRPAEPHLHRTQQPADARHPAVAPGEQRRLASGSRTRRSTSITASSPPNVSDATRIRTATASPTN